MRLTRPVWLAVAAAAVLAASSGLVLGAFEPSWWQGRPATCVADRCFCEADRGSLPRQPVDAWTSLAYVAVGLGLLASTRVRRSGWAVGVALAAVALGAGSLAYHSSLSHTGQWLDVMGMYVVAVLLGAGALVRGGRARVATAIAIGTALAVGLGLLQWEWPELRRWAFALVLLPALVVAWRLATDRRWLRRGVLLLAAAYALWWLDERLVLCDPESVLQGHGAWHLLTALSVGCLGLHAASEPGRSTPGRPVYSSTVPPPGAAPPP